MGRDTITPLLAAASRNDNGNEIHAPRSAHWMNLGGEAGKEVDVGAAPDDGEFVARVAKASVTVRSMSGGLRKLRTFYARLLPKWQMINVAISSSPPLRPFGKLP